MVTYLKDFYRDINYSTIANCNQYYKEILNSGVLPRPKFYSIVSQKIGSQDDQQTAKKLQEHTDKIKLDYESISRSALLIRMRTVYQKYPQDDKLCLLFARVLFKKELYSDAQFYLELCCQANGENSDGWALQSLLASLAGDHGKALRCSEKALKLGNHLYRSLPKAWLFTKFLLGRTAKFKNFDSIPLSDNNFIDVHTAHPVSSIKIHRRPERGTKDNVIFFACDAKYFWRYANTLLASLTDVKTNFTFHVHIIGPLGDIPEWIDLFELNTNSQVILSNQELPAKFKENYSYLASCRFMAAPYFIKEFNRGYIIIDTDALLNNPRKLNEFIKNSKNTTLSIDTSGPIWDYLCAAFSYFPASLEGQEVADYCAQYLIKMFSNDQSGFWYVDQFALFSASLEYESKINLLPIQASADPYYDKDAFFWTLSNDKDEDEYLTRCSEIKSKLPTLFQLPLT